MTISLPASKSLSNRALILDYLSGEVSTIHNLSDSDDTRILKKVLESISLNHKGTINVGAAGTAMRFLTAYLAQYPGEWTLTGDERMKQRPIGALVDALIQAGAEIEYLEASNYPPLYIKGQQLKGGKISIDASISSQFISALLMIAPKMNAGLSLQLTRRLISEPYVRMTLSLMKEFGIRYAWRDGVINIPHQLFRPVPITIEGDWSAASYWYEMMALDDREGENILLKGLWRNSFQGDAKVAQLFEPLGVKTTFTGEGALLQKADVAYPKRMDYDFSDLPDLVQTLVVTCCLLNIPFYFTGLQSLRIKETDRIAALKQEMVKLGYILISTNYGLLWDGTHCQPVQQPVIDTHNDHRMAMAFAPAALRINGLSIDNPLVVSKSYPYFWNDLKKAGFIIEEE